MTEKKKKFRFTSDTRGPSKGEEELVFVKPDEWLLPDFSECMENLFDPNNVYNLPIEEQLAKFKKRDLRQTKLFKAAQDVYRGKFDAVRTRRFQMAELIAAGTENALDVSTLDDLRAGCYTPPPLPPIQSDIGPPRALMHAPPADDKLATYKSRLAARMKLRSDLESLGDLNRWIWNKPAASRTPLELQYLRNKYEEERLRREASRVVPKTQSKSPPPREIPRLNTPPPHALNKLDKHIYEKRWRIMELFTAADKDKRWRLSVEECLRICEEEKLGIPRAQLDSLVQDLDRNDRGEIDYRDLYRGVMRFRRECEPPYRLSSASSDRARSASRLSQSLSQAVYSLRQSPLEPFDMEPTPPLLQQQQSVPPGKTTTTSFTPDAQTHTSPASSRPTTAMSTHSRRPASVKFDERLTEVSGEAASVASVSQQQPPMQPRPASTGSQKKARHLTPPPIDTGVEAMVLNTEVQVDARHRDMQYLDYQTRTKRVRQELGAGAKYVLRVGYKPWDDHVAPSTQTANPHQPRMGRSAARSRPATQASASASVSTTMSSAGRSRVGSSAAASTQLACSAVGQQLPPSLVAPFEADDPAAAQKHVTTGEMVDRFRQRTFREYMDVIETQQRFDLPVREKQLERVLLYPADRSHARIRRHVRLPEGRPTAAELEAGCRTGGGHRLRHGRRGEGDADGSGEDETATSATGRSGRSRSERGDESSTLQARGRGARASGRSKADALPANAFWPGSGDHLRLCMPPYGAPYRWPDKGLVHFYRVGGKPQPNELGW